MHNFGILFLWALAACTLLKGSLATSLRGGNIFQLDDKSSNQSDSICLPELRSLLNDVVQAQNQGNTNTRESDNEIKSKLETLEVKIGEVQAKLEGQLLGVEAKLEGQQVILTKLEDSQVKLEGSLLAVQTKLEVQLQAVVNQLQAMSTKVEPPREAPKVEVPASSTITIPSGFELIGTRYFRIVNKWVTQQSAEKRCREMGGYLASFRNEEEINAIRPKLNNWPGYWLGINDRENEGHFVSVASQKPAPFLKWKEGEPSDRYHMHNCVILYNGQRTLIVIMNCVLFARQTVKLRKIHIYI